MYITAKKYSIGLKYIFITEFMFECNTIMASWSEIYLKIKVKVKIYFFAKYIYLAECLFVFLPSS